MKVQSPTTKSTYKKYCILHSTKIYYNVTNKYIRGVKVVTQKSSSATYEKNKEFFFFFEFCLSSLLGTHRNRNRTQTKQHPDSTSKLGLKKALPITFQTRNSRLLPLWLVKIVSWSKITPKASFFLFLQHFLQVSFFLPWGLLFFFDGSRKWRENQHFFGDVPTSRVLGLKNLVTLSTISNRNFDPLFCFEKRTNWKRHRPACFLGVPLSSCHAHATCTNL